MLPTPAVKICCIADEGEAALALAHGARALGLVSAMPSGPGVIDDATVARLAQRLRGQPVQTFLLTARTEPEAIAAQHAQAGTDTLQLVKALAPQALRALRRLCPGVTLVQVVHVTGPDSLAQAEAAAPWVDALLLDSGNPRAAVPELGGTGRTHDWALARRIRDAVHPRPLWLAGGLRPDNVAEAIATVRPHGVDVCTGVRHQGHPGGLAADRLAAFMAAVSLGVSAQGAAR